MRQAGRGEGSSGNDPGLDGVGVCTGTLLSAATTTILDGLQGCRLRCWPTSPSPTPRSTGSGRCSAAMRPRQAGRGRRPGQLDLGALLMVDHCRVETAWCSTRGQDARTARIFGAPRSKTPLTARLSGLGATGGEPPRPGRHPTACAMVSGTLRRPGGRGQRHAGSWRCRTASRWADIASTAGSISRHHWSRPWCVGVVEGRAVRSRPRWIPSRPWASSRPPALVFLGHDYDDRRGGRRGDGPVVAARGGEPRPDQHVVGSGPAPAPVRRGPACASAARWAAVAVVRGARPRPVAGRSARPASAARGRWSPRSPTQDVGVFGPSPPPGRAWSACRRVRMQRPSAPAGGAATAVTASCHALVGRLTGPRASLEAGKNHGAVAVGEGLPRRRAAATAVSQPSRSGTHATSA